MQLSDFDFELPDALIAQSPMLERSTSRLLHVAPDRLEDRRFRDLPALLAPGDLLVVNDTRVIKARLLGEKADTRGRIEALIERITGPHTAVSQLRASKTPRPGTALTFGDREPRARARVEGRDGEFFVLHFDQPVHEVLERLGQTPLPPYIGHTPDAADDARYQTVYAREPGAVAAPTAGLHFDDALFDELGRRGVRRASITLHVGAGTFQPVRTENLAQHRMHEEVYRIPEATAQAIGETRARGGRVVAVGTTSLRALEAAALEDGQVRVGDAATRLFITPGYPFRVVDRLVTNFHLPRSTLLMLVSAFAGHDVIRRAYAHAIAGRYRFFSYGDAMLLQRHPPSPSAGPRA